MRRVNFDSGPEGDKSVVAKVEQSSTEIVEESDVENGRQSSAESVENFPMVTEGSGNQDSGSSFHGLKDLVVEIDEQGCFVNEELVFVESVHSPISAVEESGMMVDLALEESKAKMNLDDINSQSKDADDEVKGICCEGISRYLDTGIDDE